MRGGERGDGGALEGVKGGEDGIKEKGEGVYRGLVGEYMIRNEGGGKGESGKGKGVCCDMRET